MKARLAGGFIYEVEHLRRGKLLDRDFIKNLLPTEGINHLLSVALKGTPQNTTWYIGLYSNNYTPLAGDTAATFPALAGECTTYDEATRPEWNEGAVSAGTVTNQLARAEFTSNMNTTVYGGFMSSAAAKGAVSGVLLSAVRFSSPKVFNVGDILRVTAGFTLTSL